MKELLPAPYEPPKSFETFVHGLQQTHAVIKEPNKLKGFSNIGILEYWNHNIVELPIRAIFDSLIRGHAKENGSMSTHIFVHNQPDLPPATLRSH